MRSAGVAQSGASLWRVYHVRTSPPWPPSSGRLPGHEKTSEDSKDMRGYQGHQGHGVASVTLAARVRGEQPAGAPGARASFTRKCFKLRSFQLGLASARRFSIKSTIIPLNYCLFSEIFQKSLKKRNIIRCKNGNFPRKSRPRYTDFVLGQPARRT